MTLTDSRYDAIRGDLARHAMTEDDVGWMRPVLDAVDALEADAANIIASVHALVECEECHERFTYCDAGNHYCPSCGASGEGAIEIPTRTDESEPPSTPHGTAGV